MRLDLVPLFLVLALAGCAHSDEKPVGPPVLAGKSVVVGTVVGHDGKPLPAAHVHLGKQSVAVAEDGTFRLETDQTGYAEVRFSGVSHAESQASLWLTAGEQQKVDVRLATHERFAPLEKVALILEKNGKLAMRDGQPMRRRPDGTFALTVDAPQGRLAYQVFHAVKAGNTMNGTQADRFEYDGGGDYLSVIDSPGGQVEIVFDPSKLPPGGAEESVQLSSDRDRRITQIIEEAHARDAELGQAAMEAMKAGEDYTEVLSRKLEEGRWNQRYAEALATEKDPAVRKVLLVSALAIRTSESGEKDPETTQLADQALADIDARSTVWGISPSAAVTMVAAATDRVRAESYGRSLVKAHPSPNVSAALLLAQMQQAMKAGENEKAVAAFDELNQRFPDSRYAFMAKRFNPSSEVRVGAPVPGFAFPGYQDPEKTISPDSLKGKTYLISLWASWCKPCIAKMDTLHALNAKYGERGFTIVAVAILDKREAVMAFREDHAKQWPMPWLHAYVPEEQADKTMKQLSAYGLPSSILVGPDGRILATNSQVDEIGLEQLVEAAMAKPQAGSQ